METKSTLIPGCYYHIFNRGNNRQAIFIEERNFRYFLELYARHISPIAETFAYCLMSNHFHFLVRIKTEDEYEKSVQTSQVFKTCKVSRVTLNPSQHFSNLFNAYSKAINKAYDRTGSLFQDRFNRILVDSDAYFLNLVFYIHYNPQKHEFVKDFRDWAWSSYAALTTTQPSRLQRDEVIDWFGGANEYQAFHQGRVDEKKIAALIEGD